MTQPSNAAPDMSTEAAELPKFHELFAPALTALAASNAPTPVRQVISDIADAVGLTADQRNERIPSGQRRLDNRVTWALSYLFQAGAVTKPARGVFQITDRGRELWRQHPDGFGVDRLRVYEEFRAFQARSRGPASSTDPGQGRTVSVAGSDDQTPLEQVSAAVAQLDAEVAADLVQRLHGAAPEFLEKAVLRLLVAMGYGGSDEAAVHLGGPGDGGATESSTKTGSGSDGSTCKLSATRRTTSSDAQPFKVSLGRCTMQGPRAG